jgi:hypothetical protein
MLFGPASPGTPPAPAVRRDPQGSLRVSLRNAATSLRRPLPRRLASGRSTRCAGGLCRRRGGRVGHRRDTGRHRGVAVAGPSSGHRRCLVPSRSSFPASPSIIPDGGISPVRLEAKACLHGAFPFPHATQAMARIHRVWCGLLVALSDRCSHGSPSAESRPLAPVRTAFAQGSFAPESLPSFSATTSPCADPRASHLPFAHLPYGRCPCRLRHPRLVVGTVPLWVCPSLLECHALYAGGLSGALDQFFPDNIGLRLLLPGSASRKFSHQTASRGVTVFDAAGIP